MTFKTSISSTARSMVQVLGANQTRKGLLFMLLATLALAAMHTLVRYISTDVHPFVIAFFRNLFGFVAVLPLIIRGGLQSLHTKRPGLIAIRLTMGIIAMLSWFYALSKVPIANATALSFSATIFATLSAWLILGERMRARRWAAIGVGIIGIIIVLRPGIEGFNIYGLLAIASAVTWGIGVTLVKKLSQTDSITSVVGWMSIGLTILSIPPAWWFWQTPSLVHLGWLFVIGCLGTIGHLCMTRALSMAETGPVMSIDFTRLIWTALFGALIFGDKLDAWTLIGAVIIFGCGLYIIFRESRLERDTLSTSK